ncbi:hypothetical protein GFV12_02860 [Desulfurobacterium thermolithotrophum]|uniref:hypothetical protein n=1 Tax=Desulfurobacterium thermolithotrophum TaxID=64160 RepID=UPI0013D0DBEA|nr:hypothetical protein [Desulfurobacterium thermolithotrophum]
MKTKKLAFLFTLLITSFSCASFKVNGEATFRLETIGNILKRCNSFENQKVALRAKYLGWNCPAECKNPGITRSDSCIVDSTGCIYVRATGGLNPITDKRKEYIFKGIVKKFKNTCYLEVVETDEVR